jgi:predicted nucleotidyltransferase
MGSAQVDLQFLVSRREAILSAARRRGASNVRVFGSVARGEADAGSDVDLLVDLEPGRSLFDLGGLLMDLEDIIGAPVGLVTEKGLRPRLRERVVRGAVSL